jgi:capsular exopolysaccharide synthesis family protein
MAKKLGISRRPGLSSFLTGQIDFEDIVQRFEVSKDESAFHVIVAGECPPNPVELLSSARMANALIGLRRVYDYIILDLPPVGEVSDAMSVAKKIDGMLLVARQNLCNRLVLNEAIRQFEFVDTKILGIVFNCTSEHMGGYSKGYYKKYYKSYT